jgi:hypothetical protein
MDVLALCQHLQMLGMALAVQVQMRKNGFKAFLYQAGMPSVPSSLCSCGRGHQTAKHIIIHGCNFSAAMHTLKDN